MHALWILQWSNRLSLILGVGEDHIDLSSGRINLKGSLSRRRSFPEVGLRWFQFFGETRNLEHMGNITLKCLSDQEPVIVVYPDGHVEFVKKPCSVFDLLHGNPDYFVCVHPPFILKNRMAADARIQRGRTYFVCATPNGQPCPNTPFKNPAEAPKWMLNGEWPRSQNTSPQSRKAFDSTSATLQVDPLRKSEKNLHQMFIRESSNTSHRAADPPPGCLIKIPFFKQCLNAIRLSKQCMTSNNHNISTHSEAEKFRVENFGSYGFVSGNSRHRRGRRRRNIVWKPVLQPISEVTVVQEFEAGTGAAALSFYILDPRQWKMYNDTPFYLA